MNTRQKRFTARRIAFSIGTFVLAGVLTIAAAAYLFDAGLEGGGETKTADAMWVGGSSVASIGNEDHYPGDVFTFRGGLNLRGSGDSARIVGLRLPGLPEGYTATVTEGCGSLVKDDGFSPTEVAIKLTVSQDAPAGEWSLKPGAGVTLTPQEQAPSNPTCAPVNGGN